MKKLFLAITCFIIALSLPAQFIKWPVMNELSNNTVNCMLESDDGYIWIGTRQGLNRFNGSSYKVYFQGDSLSLANDYVAAMCKDTDGRIWLGTSIGISLLRNGVVDPSVDVRYGSVSSIASYDGDRLLVMIRNSLYLMDKKTLAMSLIWQDDSVVSGRVYVTSDGSIWIYDRLAPVIYVLDKDFSLTEIIVLPCGSVNSVLEITEGQCFVATDKGLYLVDCTGHQYDFSDDLEEMTKGENVLFLTQNSNGTRCMGITGKGIVLFDDCGNGIRSVWEAEHLTEVQYAEAILTDENIFLSKDLHDFSYQHLSSDKSVIKVSDSKDENLNMFYTFSENKVLLLTNRNIYLKEIGSDDTVKIPVEGMTSRDWMTISLVDRDSCIWILNNGNQLNRYAYDGKKFRKLLSVPVEKTNSIWGGKGDEGVYLLQSSGIISVSYTGEVRRHRMMKYPDFWFCGTTGSGMTYFLDNGGVWCFDDEKSISRLPVDVPSPECLYEDQDGVLWIGSQTSGIFVYDPKTGITENINMSHGIPDNTTRSIVGDRNGDVWVSSRCEVYRISREGRIITMFGNPENMDFSYNTNSSSSTDGGYVLFGSKTHISVFSSVRIPLENNLEVCIDGIVIGGVPLDIVPESIELDHDKNYISFYYSAMNFDPGMKLSYGYRLEGHDNEWIYVGSATRVNFSGLKPGKYNLVVGVQNSSGLWSTRQLECPFTVKPSFWLSGVAIAIYLLVLAVCLYGLYRMIRKLNENRRELEHAAHEKLLNESLNKEKTDFFTNISHEYRTPLTLIYGPVRELLGSNSLNEHDRYLISLVAKNTERMMGLTDQVLSYYTYDDKETLKVMKFEVSVFLKSMLHSFDYMFRQKELTLNIEIPDGIKAYCDREKIERILFNVLSNAAKYTMEGGVVTVEAGVADDNLIISVADTGVGISPDKIKSIFDRFDRGDMEGGNLPGFGIGLNYALHLAVLHKGLLTVAPNLPKGSVFTLSVPSSRKAYDPSEIIMDTEASNENAIIPDEKVTDMKETTILIAEDNIELANYMRHLLLDEYNVILASNGVEAMECIKVSAPDIVISDIMMPFKDGYELCYDIKSNPEFCHLPIILLTAKADMDSQIIGMEAGADAYLKKPFEPNLLFAVIKGIIDNRNKLQKILTSSVAEMKVDEEEQVEMNRHDRLFIEKLHAMMEEHLADEEFNVTAMSKEFGMSRTSLFSKIKALYGASPQTWITDYRLNKAMELLKTREYNVSEVSYKVGFSTLTGFSRSFKNKFGFPPSAV